MATTTINKNLTQTARDLGVSLGALLAANPQLSNPNAIRAGTKLRIPGRRQLSASANARQMARVFEATSAAETFGFIEQHGGSIFNATRSLLDAGGTGAGRGGRSLDSPTGGTPAQGAAALRGSAALTPAQMIAGRATGDQADALEQAGIGAAGAGPSRDQIAALRARTKAPVAVGGAAGSGAAAGDVVSRAIQNVGLTPNQQREYDRLIATGVPQRLAQAQARTFAKKDFGDILKELGAALAGREPSPVHPADPRVRGEAQALFAPEMNAIQRARRYATTRLGLRGAARDQWVRENSGDFLATAAQGDSTPGIVVPTDPGTVPSPAEVAKWGNVGDTHPTRGAYVGSRLDTSTGNLIPTWEKDLRSGQDIAFTLTDPTTGEEMRGISYANLASSARYVAQALWYAGHALGQGDVGLWDKRRPNMIAGPVADQLTGNVIGGILDPATGEPYETTAGLMGHMGYRLTDTGWWIRDVPASVGSSNNYLATLGGYGERSYYKAPGGGGGRGGGGGGRRAPATSAGGRSDGRYNWHIAISV